MGTENNNNPSTNQALAICRKELREHVEWLKQQSLKLISSPCQEVRSNGMESLIASLEMLALLDQVELERAAREAWAEQVLARASARAERRSCRLEPGR